MSNVSQLPSTSERKERRRLHLREVSETTGTTETAESAEEKITVGATLRAARLARGHDADAVAAALKMRPDQLEAVENDDFARLPGRTYAVGFVRAYARFIGLDDEALLQQFKEETAGRDEVKPATLVFPVAREERQLPNGSILILALVIAMVIYGLSYLTTPNRKTPTTTARAESPVVVVEETSTEETARAGMAAALATKAHTQPSGTAPGFVAGTTDIPATDGASMTFTESPHANLSGTQLPQMATFVLADNIVQQGLQAGTESAAADGRVTLRALEQTYMRIRDGAQATLVERVLEPGETYNVPDRSGLVMRTGNAGGLQVEVDGRNVGVLGKSGEVVSRIPVDPSYFLERVSVSQ